MPPPQPPAPSDPDAGRRFGVRALLFAFALALIIPAVAVAALLLWSVEDQARRSSEAQLTATARALALATDRELARRTALVRALSVSPALRRGDFAAFHAEARAATDGGDTWIVVAREDLRQVVNTRLPWGTPLPEGASAPPTTWAGRHDGADVSGVFPGPLARRPVTAVRRRVTLDDGRVVFVAAAAEAAAYDRIFADGLLPQDWTGAVIDRAGVLVSRSRDAERFRGRPATADVRALMSRHRSVVSESTTLDGTSVLSALEVHPDYGWAVIVGVPSRELVGVGSRPFLVGLAAAVVLLALGAAAATWFGARLTRPLERLAQSAMTWVREGGDLRPDRSLVREIDDLGRTFAFAASAVASRERRLSAAEEATATGTYAWDIQAEQIYWSPGQYRIYGIPEDTPAEAIYEAWLKILHPEDRERADRETRAFLERPGPLRIDFRVVRPDGEVRYIQGRGRMECAPDGTPLRMYGVNIDVTELRRAELARQESETRLRLAVEAGRMAVWSTDVQTEAAEVSPEVNTLLGFPPDVRLTTEGLRALYLPGELERLRAEAAETFAAKAKRAESTLRLRDAQGRERVLLLRGEVSYDSRGAPDRILGVMVDLTDEVRGRERLKLLVDELNHRVKNTLATVLSLALQSGRSAQDKEAFLRSFTPRIKSMAKTHELLTRENWEGARVAEVLETELKAYRSDEGANIVLSGEPYDLRMGARAAVSLALVVHEMATNAAKYGALRTPGGRLEIAWTQEGEEAVLRWTEHAEAPVSPPERAGFGGRLIRRLVEGDLGGTVETRYAPHGLEAVLRFRLEGATA